MDDIGLYNDLIIRDYLEEDYDEIVKFWYLTDIGNPERGDSKETIKRTLELGGKLLVMESKSSKQICGTSWMTFDGAQVKLEVHSTNLKAINLYKKLGFKHLGEYNVYITRDISNFLS